MYPYEPSPSPTIAATAPITTVKGSSVTSGGNADSKKSKTNTDQTGSSTIKGESTDDEPIGAAAPSTMPMGSFNSPQPTRIQTGEHTDIIGDPSPAPGVSFTATTSSPTKASIKNGIIFVIEKTIEKVIARINGEGVEAPTRAPTAAVIPPPTFIPTAINSLARAESSTISRAYAPYLTRAATTAPTLIIGQDYLVSGHLANNGIPAPLPTFKISIASPTLSPLQRNPSEDTAPSGKAAKK